MLDIKSLVFVGLMMQGLGTLFLTVQLWGPVWGLENALGLKDMAGHWRHLVRDGLLLHVAGSAINILAFSYWFAGG